MYQKWLDFLSDQDWKEDMNESVTLLPLILDTHKIACADELCSPEASTSV
jgi:hypothetical protein